VEAENVVLLQHREQKVNRGFRIPTGNGSRPAKVGREAETGNRSSQQNSTFTRPPKAVRQATCAMAEQ